ncbi:MAG: hypothetical protein JOZ94_29450 [Xanthobacteraceae bacterium]|nr:hypothetical protein [Xanthobacteraceae bacterium]MBV9628565.1 hypothetical protein [Xanthobacteraceae bacterium]
MRQTLYWLVICALILPAALPAEPAHAACRPFDPRCVPSVLDRHPFEPTVCSVFQRFPCVPRWPGTLGEDLLLTIQSSKIGEYAKPDHDLNTISDLFAALRSCWQPPDGDNASPGTQMTIRMSFKRDGEVFGQPRVTYSTRGISKETRATYHDAIVAAITRCAPLQLTKGLGGAIAGRPINIRYVDDRGDKQGQLNDQH